MANDRGFQDRLQSFKAGKVGPQNVPNTGGMANARSKGQEQGYIPPPALARARKDTIQRPVGPPAQAGAPGVQGPPQGPPNVAPDRPRVRVGDKRLAPVPTRMNPPVPGQQALDEQGFAQPSGGPPTEAQPMSAPPSPANQRAISQGGPGVTGPPMAPGQQEGAMNEYSATLKDQEGNQVSVKGAQPQPTMDPAQASAIMADMPSPSARQGEALLGINIPDSDMEPSGREFPGEIGPGMPANNVGAVGVPGTQNSPEDVAINQDRFNRALEQNRGDQYLAAMSSGSFPSGNPMAEGTMGHVKDIAESVGGDGIDPASLPHADRQRYRADTIRQLEEFGAYPGMGDPDAPTPPVRPMSNSFNPYTGKWTSPEGMESMIERFGGTGNG